LIPYFKLVKSSLEQFKKLAIKKGEVVEETKNYHDKNWYSKNDLHDIVDNTPREDEITDYL